MSYLQTHAVVACSIPRNTGIRSCSARDFGTGLCPVYICTQDFLLLNPRASRFEERFLFSVLVLIFIFVINMPFPEFQYRSRARVDLA